MVLLSQLYSQFGHNNTVVVFRGTRTTMWTLDTTSEYPALSKAVCTRKDQSSDWLTSTLFDTRGKIHPTKRETKNSVQADG